MRGYSASTVKTYKETLQEAIEIIDFSEENNLIYFNLMPYRIYIKELNPKTISKKLSAIRSFVEYINMEKLTVVLSSDESIKVATTLPKPIAHKHILEALKLADIITPTLKT